MGPRSGGAQAGERALGGHGRSARARGAAATLGAIQVRHVAAGRPWTFPPPRRRHCTMIPVIGSWLWRRPGGGKGWKERRSQRRMPRSVGPCDSKPRSGLVKSLLRPPAGAAGAGEVGGSERRRWGATASQRGVPI